MTTKLETTLKREIDIKGQPFTLAISPVGLKLTAKGKRNGRELTWIDVLGNDAAAGGAPDPMSEG